MCDELCSTSVYGSDQVDQSRTSMASLRARTLYCCCWIIQVCRWCCCINSLNLQITHNNITFEIHFIDSMLTVNARVISGPRRHFCGGRSRPVFAGDGRWCVGGDFSHTPLGRIDRYPSLNLGFPLKVVFYLREELATLPNWCSFNILCRDERAVPEKFKTAYFH